MFNIYQSHNESTIRTRYLTHHTLWKALTNYPKTLIGRSVEGADIYRLVIGTGSIRIAIWSQMHGNESTGTRAIIDLIHFLSGDHPLAGFIKNRLQIMFIPMVNPDGAAQFNRRNALSIDINRDFLTLQAPETVLLKNEIEAFSPAVCFNLHDQRTIFNVSGTSNSAILSFLSPAENIDRLLTDTRKSAMSIIAAMNQVLQKHIPNHIGRYTDEFYPTAFGDNLQRNGYITILIEAGGKRNDLERQEVRYYNWLSLLTGLEFIGRSTSDDLLRHYNDYFNIPENAMQMMDIIYRNVTVKRNQIDALMDLGIMLNETLDLSQNKLMAHPRLEQLGDLSNFYGYTEIDAQQKIFSKEDRNYPLLNEAAMFELL